MVVQRAAFFAYRTIRSMPDVLQIDVHALFRQGQFHVPDAPMLVKAEQEPVMVVELHAQKNVMKLAP